ncbi:sphingosine-1-phosphate phosphatase 2 isoform 2-T2 [Menidia menidia]
MLKVWAYLMDPGLVTRFQRRCGLVLVEASRHGEEKTRAPEEEGSGWGKARGRLGGDMAQRNGSWKSGPQESRCAAGACGQPGYEVKNWPLHCLFLLSAGLGHEIFYITCLPNIHWSLDPFLCRRLVNMWTVVMYVGQVMKDVLKLPRPPSPPVVKLETRVDAEYGLPSTHAMAATSISFTLLISATSRFQFQFEAGLLLAVTLSSLVCLSRLYTGMHSVLDVVSGVLLSAAILLCTRPYWEAFDRFQLTSGLSPVLLPALLLVLGYAYPELDRYSTARGDTATILGVCAGCSVGYWLNQRLGRTFEPPGPLPAPLPALTPRSAALGAGRFLVGAAALVGTRQVVKKLTLRLLYSWYGVKEQDENARRRREIEVPSKFGTYTAVGLVNSVLVNRVFVLLGLL